MGEPIDDPQAPSGNRAFEEHLKSRSTWLRLFFMIVLAFFYAVSRLVTVVVIVAQFCHVLFTGETNRPLRDFGLSLATYTYQILCYLTFNTEQRPFPFDAEWPQGKPT
jgi:uncharacterized protein YqhQ